MEKYIIFTDIDGTIFDHDNQRIPTKTYEAILKAKELGHKVFLSTGRSYSDLDEIFKELPSDGLILGCGAQVIINNEIIYNKAMPLDIVEDLLKFFTENNIGFAFEGEKKIFIYGYAFEMYRGWLSYLNNDQPLSDEKLLDILSTRNTYPLSAMTQEDKQHILKASFFTHQKESVENYIQNMNENLFAYFDSMSPGVHSGEFYMKEVNKGNGIKEVCKYLNHPIENTIALGDSMNDTEMIQVAQIGVAMGNAQPKLKEIADFVTKHIAEDGFEYALKHFEII